MAAILKGGRNAACRRLLRPDGLRHGLSPGDRQGVAGPEARKSPADHPLYHAQYDIKQVEYTPRVPRISASSTRRSWKGLRSTGGWPWCTAGST